MNGVLRFCFWLKIAIEGFFYIVILASSTNKPLSEIWFIPLYVVIIVGQIFLYRYINSSWKKIDGSTKVILVLLAVVPSPFVVIGFMFIIVGIPLLFLLGSALGGQSKYKRTIRDAETRGNIEQIRWKLEDIDSKL